MFKAFLLGRGAKNRPNVQRIPWSVSTNSRYLLVIEISKVDTKKYQ